MSKKGGQKPGPEPPNGKPAVKASPANAWNRPLKARTPGPPPGMGPNSKANSQGSSSNDAGMKAMLRDRLLHLTLTLVGQNVTLTQTNGSVLEGVFHTFTPYPNLKAELKNKYALKAVRVVKPPTNGDSPVEDGSTVIIPVKKVVHVQAKNVNLDRPTANGGPGFTAPNAKKDVVTDTQISGAKLDNDRELVSAGSAWTSGGKGQGGGLDDNKGGMTRAGFGTARPTGLKGNIGQWDQFRANEELFNVQASYDENLYTTELDKASIDAKKVAAAERIAKEIEGTTSTNMHIAEERGHVVETDLDEEDRYSGVLTKDGKQRHDVKGSKAAAPKMNYAAAAAKAEPTKKATPPGFTGKSATSADDKGKEELTGAAAETEDKKDTSAEEKETKNEEKEKAKTEESKKDSTKEESKNGEKEKPKLSANAKSKLNANAKSFSFNPSAKSFTPGGFTPQTAQPQHADPNAQMHVPPMQPPHYMHSGPMGQPGMMPMMNQQFQGMRYPPQYQPVDQQQMVPMQSPQPQHSEAPPAAVVTPSAEEAGGAPAPVKPPEGEAGSRQQDEASQQNTPQQQYPMQAQYNVPPPGAYYQQGGMQMHPRGPGYPAQFVGNPQQVPVVPAGARGYPVYQMQPGGMSPNMHMRAPPNGNPYYSGSGGPPPGPYGGGSYGGHGMMEDGDPNFRGRGGRGPGRGGRGRRNGRGRGRGGYNGGRGSSQQGSNDSAANGNDSKQRTEGSK